MKRPILIVDDNPVNQFVLLRAVRSLGHEGEAASSGEQALDLVRSREFDLVLMDCQMPGMNGYEAAAEIRRLEAEGLLLPRIPIIAMAANDAETDWAQCLASGLDDYLAKPVRFASLASTLECWVGRGSAVSMSW